MALVISGWRGLWRLVCRLCPRREHIRWLVLAALGPPALHYFQESLVVLLTGGSTKLAVSVDLSLFRSELVLILFLGAGLGEELGWRGFALPRLQSRMNALRASLVLGAFWGAWHFPNLWWPGEDPWIRAYQYPRIFLGSIAVAVIYTWVYNSTKGSLLVVAVIHASNNASASAIQIDFLDSAMATGGTYYIMSLTTLATMWTVALVVIHATGRQRLSPQPAG